MHRHRLFISALAALFTAGCPDDPEPAGTGPECKKGECPVDQPLPNDPPIATPAPAPMSRSVGSTWSERGLRGGTDVVIDEASHGSAPVPSPTPREAVPARAPTEPPSPEPMSQALMLLPYPPRPTPPTTR
jgi:hypothetical protein